MRTKSRDEMKRNMLYATVAALVFGVISTIAGILAVRADIVSTVGLSVVDPPATVSSSFIINAGLPPQLVFREQQDVLLTAPLDVDAGISITAGTIVSSYFFAVNAPFPGATVDTSVLFDSPVLGIIYSDGPNPYGSGSPVLDNPRFAASDFLGSVGTTYLESLCHFCGFETTAIDFDAASFAGNTAALHTYYNEPGDFARVITEGHVAVPGPIVGAGIPGIIAALGAMLALARRRRMSR